MPCGLRLASATAGDVTHRTDALAKHTSHRLRWLVSLGRNPSAISSPPRERASPSVSPTPTALPPSHADSFAWRARGLVCSFARAGGKIASASSRCVVASQPLPSRLRPHRNAQRPGDSVRWSRGTGVGKAWRKAHGPSPYAAITSRFVSSAHPSTACKFINDRNMVLSRHVSEYG